MWKLFKKILQTGILTEPQQTEAESAVFSPFRKSLAIRHVDAGSCNGCELELWALENPIYSMASRGIKFVASPRHADLLLVTGPVTLAMRDPLLRTHEALPCPRRVMAVGDCACDGGVFRGSYATLGGLDPVILPDFKVPGCPPSPRDLLNALQRVFDNPSPDDACPS